LSKLEISWRIPKESKQSKVRQDRYCSTQKQKEKEKENSINILAIQHAFTRIFNDTEKLSSDSSKSLSPHTAIKEALQFTPRHTHTLSLPLSCPLWWQVQTRVGRVLGIAPASPSGYQFWVSNSATTSAKN
jgi:hypothetical protein